MPILSTVRKYATIIKWGGIILVVAGILYAVYDYSQSKERLDNMEDKNEQLIEDMQTLQTNINEQKKRLTQIRSSYNEIELLYSSQLEEINQLRELTSNYIISNQPKIEKEINSRFNTIQNNIECVSGNKTKC